MRLNVRTRWSRNGSATIAGMLCRFLAQAQTSNRKLGSTLAVCLGTDPKRNRIDLWISSSTKRMKALVPHGLPIRIRPAQPRHGPLATNPLATH